MQNEELKEKLIIKNFGPIKHVELELGRFNVLIGEQATGKSTVAKLLAVCRYFSYIVNPVNENPIPFPSNFEEGLGAWGLNEALQTDSFIYYESKHYTLTANTENINWKSIDVQTGLEKDTEPLFRPKLTNLSNDFKNLLQELEQIKPQEDFLNLYTWTPPTSFYQNDVAKVMDNPFYLPAERGLQSIFSLGKSSIQNISDSLFNQLANLDRIARLFKNETLIEPLDIIYKNIDGKGFIKKLGDTKFYSLFNAATGYQSTIPIVLVAKYYNELRRKSKTFIVEEVELNLYPTAQKRIVKFLAYEVINHDKAILLTTHSPYILTSLNNLMYAYQLGKTNDKKITDIISQDYWLNPAEVSVYRLLTDGTSKNILDTEINQIDAGEIDEVSRVNNKEWDDLLNIEANG